MKAFGKNTLREIARSKSRFLSIFLICAIGVGFFSGVRAASGDMKASADKFYDKSRLFDLRVLSTFGMTDADADELEKIEDVTDVFVSKYTDLALHCGDDEYLTRVYSKVGEGINTIEIKEGRDIENDGECLVSYSKLSQAIEIGGKVSLEDLTGAEEFPLKRKEYTVVGRYDTPMFISVTQRGSTNIGDGGLDAFLIVDIDEFVQDHYTEIYLRSDKLAGMASYSDEYEDAREEISGNIEKLGEERSKARYDEVLGDALREISDGERDLEKAKIEGKKELDEAKKKIEDGEAELAKSRKEIDEAKEKIAENEKTISDGEKKLADGRKELSEQKKALDEGKKELEAARGEYEKGLREYNAGAAQVEQLAAALGENDPQVAAQRAVLAQAKARLDAAAALISENEEKIASGEAALNAGQAELDRSERELEQGKKQLEQARGDINEGERALEEGRAELEQAKKDYDEGAEKYDREISDAEKKLADARKKIEDTGDAKWYVFTRDDNAGYSEYEANAERINKISIVFPIFFLLVAGLVCLTTMSRMVEEQRTQIGTLKALGYSRHAIIRHYMMYAVSGAVIGGTLGALGGCVLFPWVIMYAYSIMYNITDFVYQFTPANMVLSIGSMTAAIALTVFFSCRKALEETPASLMRPRAPKAGKRIWLEKIPFIWNRMNFFAKISGRNIFRYKRRMFMTVVGIAGCTALSLTGFGLKDSIGDIVDLQYRDIYQFSGFLVYDDKAAEEEVNSIFDDLTGYNAETTYTRALIKKYELKFGGKTVQTYVTAAEDADVFQEFIRLRERVSKKKLSMKDGAIITEKCASLLGAKEGDEIEIRIKDGVTKSVVIKGIAEQYSSHYLYLEEGIYEEIFGEKPQYSMVYFENGIHEDKEKGGKFSEVMLKNDHVTAVMMNAESLKTIKDTLSILDMVTIVLIVSAGALALVVLYNLTSVNITERIREIATLKVLGFYDAEVSSYVFRENIVLSLMGGAAGLVLGSALCMFVITTAEIDEVMFGRSIHLLSYVWAFLVTIGFSMLVNLIMTKTLKKISMVESLKSVE